MHTSLRAPVKLCAQRGPACFSDSIYTLISLMKPNLADIWAYACKHIGCKHAGTCAPGEVCAQIGQACSPDFTDALISLFHSNLA